MNQPINKYENLPLVSVIIPAYNAEIFIEITLNYVLNQTYQNLEVLVVDDGSQDNTAVIVKSIAEKDNRVILLQQANAGVAAARNLGIKNSRGEFIAPLDADDIWYPQNLEKQVGCIMRSHPSVGLVYAWSVDIDEEDALSGGFHVSDYQGEVYIPLLYHDFFGNASSTLIRRSCLEKVGGYDCELKSKGAQGCEDWDLYLRIAECYQVGVVPEFLVGYRQINSSMSQNYNSMAKSHNLVLEFARQKHPEIPAAIYRWSASNFYVHLAHKSIQSGNPWESLSWLSKAVQLDLTMMLLRPDLYLLMIQIIWENLAKPRGYKEAIKVKSSQAITIDRINRMIKIRKDLPSKMYEKNRLNWISNKAKNHPKESNLFAHINL